MQVTFAKKPQMNMNSLKKQKHGYNFILDQTKLLRVPFWIGQSHLCMEGHMKITLTVPLKYWRTYRISDLWKGFMKKNYSYSLFFLWVSKTNYRQRFILPLVFFIFLGPSHSFLEYINVTQQAWDHIKVVIQPVA